MMGKADRTLWLAIVASAILSFLILPSLIVVVVSFSADSTLHFPPRTFSLDWYRQFLSSGEWLAALSMSLRVGFLASLIATISGTLASFGLRRLQGPTASALRALLLSPAIVPVVLIASATFLLMARMRIDSRFSVIVASHAALALPFVLITMSAALETYDFALDRAARSLGASPFRSFLTVTLPQLKGPLGAAALFAFLTSFDEAVIALFITGGSSATLAQRMFESLRDDLDPIIAAISTLLIALTSTIFVLARVLGARTERQVS
jgi:putative spermidine/putrescine transport system permease protein